MKKSNKMLYSVIALIIFAILIVLFELFGTILVDKLNTSTTIIIAGIFLVVIIIMDILLKHKNKK